MPKVRKPRRGRGGVDDPPEYDWDEAPPPDYDDHVDEKKWNYPGSYLQFPPPPYVSVQAAAAIAQRVHLINQLEQELASNPSPIRRAQIEHEISWHRRHIQAWRNEPAEGGKIVNTHAKRTGILMRKHKITLAEASRRAAHSRNAKTKAGRGRSGSRKRSVPKSQNRATK